MPDLIETYLTEHDCLCPACRYNLRGLKSPACPECGATLSLVLATGGGSLSRWEIGLLGLSMSATLAVGFVLCLALTASPIP